MHQGIVAPAPGVHSAGPKMRRCGSREIQLLAGSLKFSCHIRCHNSFSNQIYAHRRLTSELKSYNETRVVLASPFLPPAETKLDRPQCRSPCGLPIRAALRCTTRSAGAIRIQKSVSFWQNRTWWSEMRQAFHGAHSEVARKQCFCVLTVCRRCTTL